MRNLANVQRLENLCTFFMINLFSFAYLHVQYNNKHISILHLLILKFANLTNG